MYPIPFRAFRLGAERINRNPVKYNKARISGYNKTTYNLHIKGACMPGNKEFFTISSKSKPELNTPLNDNQHMMAFKLEKTDLSRYSEFVPNDDDALLIAINASYRQVFGNLKLMDFERPIEPERRLRNGDITIREFIRQLCKSSIYRYNYFDKINQNKSIHLVYKHILGRPIRNQNEYLNSSLKLNNKGFDYHINFLIDSEEYNKVFGEDIVPYMRCWDSPNGYKTEDFLKTMSITKAFATSDVCRT